MQVPLFERFISFLELVAWVMIGVSGLFPSGIEQ